jgi:hypothetical protein
MNQVCEHGWLIGHIQRRRLEQLSNRCDVQHNAGQTAAQMLVADRFPPKFFTTT